MKKGTLYLVPNTLGIFGEADSAPEVQLPAVALSHIRRLRHFVAESEKAAWRLLSRVSPRESLAGTELRILDEHTPAAGLAALLLPLENGTDVGIMSDAGIPCVADPGAALVALAHARGIKVVPLSGPSSLILALSASGLDGQRFSFLGYLPQEASMRRQALSSLDKGIRSDGATRIFIETPYRNEKILDDCLSVFSKETMLCIARALTTKDEFVRTDSISGWQALRSPIGKHPTVFLAGKAAKLSPKP
ncbi:MAG: SAM-dependent methyltransferase [Rectinemataceae bacterium]|nr:SAM-dependent methyltransferase [Rectinemataceae bacterium]